MKKILTFSLLVSSLLAGVVEIKEPYVKQTAPGMKNTAIFMEIKNNSDKTIKLINAKEHTLGGVTEIHTHLKQDDGSMKMVKIPFIKIEPNSSTLLKPKSYHVMVIGIDNAVKSDTKANLTLEFDNGEKVEVKDIISKEIKHKHHWLWKNILFYLGFW